MPSLGGVEMSRTRLTGAGRRSPEGAWRSSRPEQGGGGSVELLGATLIAVSPLIRLRRESLQ